MRNQIILVLALLCTASFALAPSKHYAPNTKYTDAKALLQLKGWNRDSSIFLVEAMLHVYEDDLALLLANWQTTELNLQSLIDEAETAVDEQTQVCDDLQTNTNSIEARIKKYIEYIKEAESHYQTNKENILEREQLRCASNLIFINRLRDNDNALKLFQYLKRKLQDPGFRTYLVSQSSALVELKHHLNNKGRILSFITKHHFNALIQQYYTGEEVDARSEEEIGAGHIDNEKAQLKLEHYVAAEEITDIDVFVTKIVLVLEDFIEELTHENQRLREAEFNSVEAYIAWLEKVERENFILAKYVGLWANEITSLRDTLAVFHEAVSECRARVSDLEVTRDDRQHQFDLVKSDFEKRRHYLEWIIEKLQLVLDVLTGKKTLHGTVHPFVAPEPESVSDFEPIIYSGEDSVVVEENSGEESLPTESDDEEVLKAFEPYPESETTVVSESSESEPEPETVEEPVSDVTIIDETYVSSESSYVPLEENSGEESSFVTDVDYFEPETVTEPETDGETLEVTEVVTEEPLTDGPTILESETEVSVTELTEEPLTDGPTILESEVTEVVQDEPSTVEVPAPEPFEAPVPTGEEGEAPVEGETPVEEEAPVQGGNPYTPAVAEDPSGTPIFSPETPAETPAEGPAGTPTEGPAGTPTETPAETPSEVPVDPENPTADTPIDVPSSDVVQQGGDDQGDGSVNPQPEVETPAPEAPTNPPMSGDVPPATTDMPIVEPSEESSDVTFVPEEPVIEEPVPEDGQVYVDPAQPVVEGEGKAKSPTKCKVRKPKVQEEVAEEVVEEEEIVEEEEVTEPSILFPETIGEDLDCFDYKEESVTEEDVEIDGEIKRIVRLDLRDENENLLKSLIVHDEDGNLVFVGPNQKAELSNIINNDGSVLEKIVIITYDENGHTTDRKVVVTYNRRRNQCPAKQQQEEAAADQGSEVAAEESNEESAAVEEVVVSEEETSVVQEVVVSEETVEDEPTVAQEVVESEDTQEPEPEVVVDAEPEVVIDENTQEPEEQAPEDEEVEEEDVEEEVEEIVEEEEIIFEEEEIIVEEEEEIIIEDEVVEDEDDRSLDALINGGGQAAAVAAKNFEIKDFLKKARRF